MVPNLPEIVFTSKDRRISETIRKFREAGHLRKLLPRVFTSNIDGSDEEIIRRNVWKLIAHLFPNALLSHRTALEYNVSPGNNIYLTANERRVHKWPGINLRFVKGVGALEDDRPFFNQLPISSFERACLENLMPSRTIGGEKRTTDQEVVENRLLVLLNTRGEQALNELRDKARKIAGQLEMTSAFAKLDLIIGSLLVTKTAGILSSPMAIAHAFGDAYDPYRLELFEKLMVKLKQRVFEQLPEKTKALTAYTNFAFYESYFSNYIEGTTFTLEEAVEIIYEGSQIPNRTGDAHDIRGTYAICGDRFELSKTPDSSEELLELLKYRHRIILQGRPDKNPGIFKRKANRAGSSFFVEPGLVKGTLKEGFRLMSTLEEPFARAIYMMFLISEVHPFDDGNGRIARVMMNAELTKAQTSKIIIPTVYRDDYILNLKKISKQKSIEDFIKMMEKIHRFSHWLEPADLSNMRQQLESTQAFKDSEEAMLLFPF